MIEIDFLLHLQIFLIFSINLQSKYISPKKLNLNKEFYKNAITFIDSKCSKNFFSKIKISGFKLLSKFLLTKVLSKDSI